MTLSVFYTYKYKRSQFCAPYKYLIKRNGASYRAFVKTSSFKRWLRERNLTLKKAGKQYATIVGDYNRVYKNLTGVATNTMVLRNGDYVPCLIETVDGITTEYVHHTGICTKNYNDENENQQRLEHYRYWNRLLG